MILQYHEAPDANHGSRQRMGAGRPIRTTLIAWTLFLLPCLMPPWADAHRGFGPAKLGLPLGVIVGLGVVCYWVVILWPASKKKSSALR